MRYVIAFAVAIICSGISKSDAQGPTRVENGKIIPYTTVSVPIPSKPATPPIGSLKSSSRTLELYQTDYLVPNPKNQGSSSAVLIGEGGAYKAYKYYSFGDVNKFEIKQLNGNGLPELILHTSLQSGGGNFSIVDEHYIVIDFDQNKVLFDLCCGYSYEADNEKKQCSQNLQFFDGKIIARSPSGNQCNTTGIGTEYKGLTIGSYQYKDNSFYLPVADALSSMQDFWVIFQRGVNGKDKAVITSLTAFPFYDGNASSYMNAAEFGKAYTDIIDEDGKIMVKYGALGRTSNTPKRPKTNGVEYEDGATVSFNEVTDAGDLKRYKAKLKLPGNAKLYALEYSYSTIVEGSSHSSQSVTCYYYFSVVNNQYKFCGKGMIL